MWEADWVTMLNSTVPNTGGANVGGTIFSLLFFTIIAMGVVMWFRNK
jgi:hypothetical protein